jgi:hypothetical protein
MMAGLLCYLRFARTRRWPLYIASLVCTAAGLTAKENAIVFPLIVAAAWYWVTPVLGRSEPQDERGALSTMHPRHSVWLLAPYFLLLVPYLLWRHHALGGFPVPPSSFYYHSPADPGFAWWLLAKMACVFFALVFQLPLAYPTEVFLARIPAAATGAFVLTVVLGLLIIRFVRGRHDDRWRRLGCFAIAWAFIALLPTAPLIVGPHYFYFPLAGMMLLYLVVWQRLTDAGRPRWFARRRLRKAIPVVAVALSILWIQGFLSLFTRVSRADTELTDRVAELVGEPADGTRIFLIDVPFWMTHCKTRHMLRWPDSRFEIHQLTIAPYAMKFPNTISRLEQPDDRTLRLIAADRPYLSAILGFIAFPDYLRNDSVTTGLVVPARGYRVEFGNVEPFGPRRDNCLRDITFYFDEPLVSPDNIFIRYADRRLERIAPR